MWDIPPTKAPICNKHGVFQTAKFCGRSVASSVIGGVVDPGSPRIVGVKRTARICRVASTSDGAVDRDASSSYGAKRRPPKRRAKPSGVLVFSEI